MTTATAMEDPNCPYCKLLKHKSLGECSMVKAIEYHENGNIKRVEFVRYEDSPQWTIVGGMAPNLGCAAAPPPIQPGTVNFGFPINPKLSGAAPRITGPIYTFTVPGSITIPVGSISSGSH